MEFHDIDFSWNKLYNITVKNRGIPQKGVKMIIAFAGHSFIAKRDGLKEKIKELIKNNVFSSEPFIFCVKY